MSTAFDKNLLPEFDTIKDDDEEILWVGKPILTPYLLSRLGGGLVSITFGIIWILTSKFGNYEEGSEPNQWFWLFGLLAILQGAYVFFNKLPSYPNTAYAYSNKRVMTRTGFIGTDFKTIDYDKISDIEVNVSVIERIFNVGTVRFYSGRTQIDEGNTTKLYDKWISIKDPYGVFKLVKQTSVDIKTDFNFPNALRPDTNPGYNTKYKRK